MVLSVKDGEVQHLTHLQFGEKRVSHAVCVQLKVVPTGQVFLKQMNLHIPVL